MVGCVPANAGACDNAVAEIAVVASRINLMFVLVSFGFETMTFGEVKRSLQSSFSHRRSANSRWAAMWRGEAFILE
jgi:hypothetical protein